MPEPRALSALEGSSVGRPEQRLCFEQRRLEPHRREELTRLAEWRLGLPLAQPDEAAALAEQRVRALAHVSEPMPALGRLGVEGGRLSRVPAGFGELGTASHESVLE
jgi:hypothetical protein